MDSHYSQKRISNKQHGKFSMPSSKISPSQIPNRSRTKVKARKATPYARIIKKKSVKSQSAKALCHKVKHLLPLDSLRVYREMFLNKPVDPEYCVDATAEI